MSKLTTIKKDELERLKQVEALKKQKIKDKNDANKQLYKIVNVNFKIAEFQKIQDLAAAENLTINQYLKNLALKKIKK